MPAMGMIFWCCNGQWLVRPVGWEAKATTALSSAAQVGARMAAGGAKGAAEDAATQLATTGEVDFSSVAVSGAIGAVSGSRAKAGTARGPSCRGRCRNGC
jgi:hypothetical protein